MPKRLSWLALIGIVLLTFIAYSSAIRGGFIWDDDSYVTQNPLLTAPHGLWQIWTTAKSPQYYPLVFSTFWLEYRLWGLHPAGYHTVNVALHALNAVILFLLLRRLEIPGAWMIGAVFAVHPVHVESVAWITERKNVLSGLFYLLSIACYLEYESKRLPAAAGLPTGEAGRWRWYAGAFGLFLLALTSKTVVATLPVALLLIRYLKGWRIGRREVLELVPFLMVGAAMGLFTKWYEVHHVGAEGPEWDLSIGERLLIAGRALVFYVVKLIWPTHLSFNYPRWQPDTGDWVQWSWVLMAGLAGLLFWWKRKAWGRAPFVGFAFFAVSLAPALGFFNVYPMLYSFVADHFQYLASIGVISIIVGSTAWGLDRIKSDTGKSLPNRMKPVLGSFVLVILMALTWKQGQIYRDLEALWLDTLNKNPDSWLAHGNLGAVYLKQDRLEEALREFLIALKLRPDYVAHYNIGTVYSAQGRVEEAIQEYLTALKLEPDFVDGHNNLGTAYLRLGRLEDAVKEFMTVLKLHPDQIAHYNLGIAYSGQGQLEKAVQEFLAALTLQPDFIDARKNLGIAYSKQGRQEEAIQEYLKILKLMPDHVDAHNNLGVAYFNQGRLEEAIREFLTVLSLKPDNTETHYNLGQAYKLKGLKDEAKKQFEMALKLNPNLTPAQKALESLN